MKPIEIFYHVYLPPDSRSWLWTWWIDDQLGLIKKSKLSSLAKVNVFITMPADRIETFGHRIMSNRTPNTYPRQINFGEKVTEYINLRYPFAEVVSIRDNWDQNIYEGQTLAALHERCKAEDLYVLYIHSKGVMNCGANTSNWREVLNYYMIEQWPRCVKQLENHDVVGLKDVRTDNLMVSGNFWWSKSDYIRKLLEPIRSDLYLPNEPDRHPGAHYYRYAFERWIVTGNPNINYQLDTETDHYGSYFFVENIPKEKR